MLIFGDIWKGICNVVNKLHCVSKVTSSSYNNLYPVKNIKYFQWETFFSVIFGFGKQTPKSYLSEKTRIMPVVKMIQ